MNLKRSFWQLLLISVSILVVGYAAWILARADQSGLVIQWAIQWLILDVGMLMMILGLVGLIACLIWWLIASIASSAH